MSSEERTFYDDECPAHADPDLDGVQYAASHKRWFFANGKGSNVSPDATWWMPPLYPFQWTVWVEHRLHDTAISIRRPTSTINEDWQPVFEGRFTAAWPVFLRYVALCYPSQ